MGLTLGEYHALYQRLTECQKIYNKCTENQDVNREKLEAEYRNLAEYSAINKKRLEDEIKKVETFKNLVSYKCRQKTESHTPIKYDNGRLAQLMVQSNSSYNGAFYAERLYTEASGQLLYLQQEIEDIDRKLLDKKEKLDASSQERSEESLIRSGEISAKAAGILNEQPVRDFFHKLTEDYRIYVEGQSEENAKIDTISMGVTQMPFPLAGNSPETVGIPEVIYDKFGENISVPVDFPMHLPMVLGITYDNSMESALLCGIQNYILNVLRYGNGIFDDILFIDPIRYSNVGLGPLMKICGAEGSILERVPVSANEAAARMNALITKLSLQNENGMRDRGRKLLIFHDFPEGYKGDAALAVRQLCANAQYYGISVIVAYNVSGRNRMGDDAYGEIKYYLTTEIDTAEGQFVYISGQDKFPFRWYQAPAFLEESVLDRYVRKASELNNGNEYLQRIGIPEKPTYYKGNRKLTNIPYGIGPSGNISFLDFENSNFATFICGASRSGKSTMLHTLLTGVLKSMHPDDVEIWLIDFKMTEFSRYVKHLPPHVRYIILDESPELVYDIVDRLTDILKKRQSIFMGKWQRLDDVPKEKYMPAMFVVIDEFSVMSHIIAEADLAGKGDYKIKMQTLLAKGAALGMHFIFASQGFTSGSQGLNDFSKKQIQQRIAMKTEYQEIVDTLDLMSKSDSDKMMMEELEVHHALVRIPPDGNGNRLKLSKVLFISDYGKQEEFIDNISRSMHPEEKYDAENAESYIDKKTLILDGNQYLSFREKQPEIKRYINDVGASDEETPLYFFLGMPKRMLPVYGAELYDEFGENVLLMASVMETEAASAVVLSAERSAEFQFCQTEVWTNKKNGIYKQLAGKDMEAAVINNLEDIGLRIRETGKMVKSGRKKKMFFVLLGFETLLEEMRIAGDVIETIPRRRKATGPSIYTQLNNGIKGGGLSVPGDVPEQEASEDSHEEKDLRETLKYILTHGPRLGYHFMMVFNTSGELKQSGIKTDLFKHKILFRMAKDDTYDVISNSREAAVVAAMEEHCFRYTNGLEGMSFKPYLHEGLTIDGWYVDQDGHVVQKQEEDEGYLL